MMMTFVPRLSPFLCLTCVKPHRKISKPAVLGARSLTESTKNRVKKLCPHLFVEHPSREKRSELECAFRRGGSGRWPVAGSTRLRPFSLVPRPPQPGKVGARAKDHGEE